VSDEPDLNEPGLNDAGLPPPRKRRPAAEPGGDPDAPRRKRRATDEPVNDADLPPPRRPRQAEQRPESARDHPGRVRVDPNRLDPVKPGWLRGRITAVDTQSEKDEMGMTTTWTFTVRPAKPDPPFTVVMRGLTITRRVNERELIEVECHGPPDQPIDARRMYLPLSRSWIAVYDAAGPSERVVRREWIQSVLMPLGPLVLIGGIVWLLWRFSGIFN
jgi:hypothetical protein